MGLFGFDSKHIRELKKLARAGDAESQYRLARDYSGGKGVSENQEKAFEYCMQSAKQEYAPAQALLAHFYGFGKGVDKDYVEMAKWAEKSAIQGYALAQYNLGRCYEAGKGKAQDDGKAFSWYKLAAEQGRSDAAYKLGQCYENGIGTEKDLKLAEIWYIRAAGRSEEDAGELRAHVEKNLNQEEPYKKYKCLSELRVGEGLILKEGELLESPFILTQAENHETELGWGKTKAVCNTATLVSLSTGKKKSSILYSDNGHISREGLKQIQEQVDDQYGHENLPWNEPHRTVKAVLKNAKYCHRYKDTYRMMDLDTKEEYELTPQKWAVPVLNKLELDTVVSIAYYEDQWYFVSKKESKDIGEYKFALA